MVSTGSPLSPPSIIAFSSVSFASRLLPCSGLDMGLTSQLVASSCGNAEYTVTYVGKKLGIPVTVFVPKTTNPIFLHHLMLEGANIKIHCDVWDEAHQTAVAFVNETNSGYVRPFNHTSLWTGHSTMIDEIIHQGEKLDAVIAAVGGGGLLCGVLEGLERQGWSDVSIFFAETEGAASFTADNR